MEDGIKIEVNTKCTIPSGRLLREMLNELEADGLCNPIKECGCPIEELAPCGCVYLNECVAAYKSGKNHYAAIETYGQALLLTA